MEQAVSLQAVLFSAVPHLFLAASLLYMAYSLYHPESFFHYQTITEKIRTFYRTTLRSGLDYFIA